MATRKDLLKAQSFISRRMVAAFVDRDPDDPTPPLRRVGTASFVSVLLGVILLAGTALIGMLRPGGGDAWKEEGVIISDTSAGMLFVLSEGSLVPMANVTSARLQAAGENAEGPPRVVKVATEKLRGTPQLPMRGIPGAPRQLPAAKDMQAAPLRLCSSAPASGSRFISLELDADPVTDDQISFVVETSGMDQYLVSGGKSHRLWRPKGEPSPLREDLPLVHPGDVWLSAIPVGAPVDPLVIEDLNVRPSHSPLGLTIGALAMVEGAEGGSGRYYVQLEDGLSRISYLDMRLIQVKYAMNEPRKISEAELATAANIVLPTTGNQDIDLGKPRGPVGYSSLEDVSVCATFAADESGKVVLNVDLKTPDMPSERVEPRGDIADDVEMETLSGGLLQRASSAAADPPSFLVLEGNSYPIPDLASRRALGYGDVQPTVVPDQLIALIPSGLEQGTNLSVGMITVIS